MTKKKLYIKTYGCQMNMYDSDKIGDVLRPTYDLCEFPEHADLILLNTCHIREKAVEKVFSDLGRLKVFKHARLQQGRQVILAVAGCVAQAEGAWIIKRAPYVDMVLGSQAYHQLPKMIKASEKAFQEGPGSMWRAPISLVETEFLTADKFDALPLPTTLNQYAAFLTIQEGCDKFCTFCSVPYTRGAEFSRPVLDIVREAKALVQNGAKEITLLGQNVTAYHGASPDGTSEWGIASLLLKLSEIDGLARLRYTTSHPNDMQKDLIEAHRTCPILMPFLHLPVQSGSNRLLKAMNRNHTREHYLELIQSFQDARPDLAVSSDFIVAFPGETDQDFEDTLSLIETVGFSQAYSFIFSSRPGTPASGLGSPVPVSLAEERLQRLQALVRTQQSAFNTSMIGKVMPVLIEKLGRKENQVLGKSPYMQSVHALLPKDKVGEICHIMIETASLSSLGGREWKP